MKDHDSVVGSSSKEVWPFPIEWLKSNPQKVEKYLSQAPIADQVFLAMRLQGEDRMSMILLSPKGVEVVRALPPEEIYYMIKRIARDDCVTLLSAVSQEQLQYIFDLEWWDGHCFLPQKALEWFTLLDECDSSQILDWFLTDEFEQKIMVLQSLIKIYKRDEMTDSYEGVEGMPNFTLDGVYDIFVRVDEAEPILKKYLHQVFEQQPKLYFSLMEAVIWYTVTPTVEEALRWRLTRTSERGIPEFDEAFTVYSQWNPEALNAESASIEIFSNEGKFPVAPRYPLENAEDFTFFCQCLAHVTDPHRVETLRWELVCLANKVMVADRVHPSSLEGQTDSMRKVLGYINIGLDLGAGGEIEKGGRLLVRSWMQVLFQVGYGSLMQLKWKAEALLKEHGVFLQNILTPAEQDHLGGLVNRFPKAPVFVEKDEPCKWRNLESLEEIRQAEKFLSRAGFMVRFFRVCLGMTDVASVAKDFDCPEEKKDLDFILLTTTAFARFTLFNEISCEPLNDIAAKSFLEKIFPPNIFKGEKMCDKALCEQFKARLLKIPFAWTSEDKALLEWLIDEITRNLEVQFGRVNLKAPVEWQYTHALLVRKASKIS
jgi:hypothetical protein